MIELACPEACQYLQDARASVSAREHELRDREAAAEGEIRHTATERLVPVLLTIEGAIVYTHRGVEGPALRDLGDAEILAALENAIKNYQTEDSGLIYEHHAASPRIEVVSRHIRTAVEKLRARYPADFRPRRDEVIQALEVERDVAQSHIKRGEGSRSYLRFISLFMPWPEKAAGPKLII